MPLLEKEALGTEFLLLSEREANRVLNSVAHLMCVVAQHLDLGAADVAAAKK
jgi:hypothetical protein